MTTPPPLAVIGAGVIGTACARALQRAGHDVVLLDPEPPGRLCSFGNAGHIAIDHIRPLARLDVLAGVPRMLRSPLGPLTLRWRGLPAMLPWLAHFAAAARPTRVEAGTLALAGLLGGVLADWHTELQASGLTGLLRQDGALNVFETAAGQRAAATDAPLLSRFGIKFRDLDAAETAARLPGLLRPPAGGRHFPRAAHVLNPHRLVHELALRFVADGGTLLAQPVSGFERRDGRVTALHTPQGPLSVSGVVLAAGVASAALAPGLGLRLPVTAERGYHVMLANNDPAIAEPATFNERGFVATPMEHGLRLAGTVEFGAAGRAPDWRRADILATHLRQLFGRSGDVLERWSGDRPTLPDYLPALGRVPGLSNAVVAAGHQHLGLTLAASTGRIVAALFGGGATQDLRAFDPARFSQGRFSQARFNRSIAAPSRRMAAG